MKISNPSKIKPKDLIVFDLDGTLAETKTPMDREMVGLMKKLLASKKVAVIGGGKYPLFQVQLLKPLGSSKALLPNLSLFPTTATSYFRYRNGWKNVYAHTLTKSERIRIKQAFKDVLDAIEYDPPKKTYGPVVEDRLTQVTWSALGQEVVTMLGKKKGVALKDKWKREHTDTKIEIAKRMAKLLPDLEVRAAGHTSVDVTKKGIDKGYGLKQIEKYLHVKIKKMLFVGDAIFPNGNDYAVVRTGVDYAPVKGPEETKKIIKAVLASTK